MKKVYNLIVNNFHTYYVGLGGVLGHNAPPCRVLHRNKPRIEEGNSKQGWIHIQERHMTEGTRISEPHKRM